MRMLAGGSPWTKILVFFFIIPIIVAIFVFVNVKNFIPDIAALGIAVIAFFMIYVLMTKIIMMA